MNFVDSQPYTDMKSYPVYLHIPDILGGIHFRDPDIHLYLHNVNPLINKPMFADNKQEGSVHFASICMLMQLYPHMMSFHH